MKFGEEASNRQPEPLAPIPFRGPSRELGPYGHAGAIHAYGELYEAGGINLMQYLHTLLKWKWVIAAAAAVGLLVGLVSTLLTTPMYQASATIEIDREPMKVLNSDGVQPRETGGDEFYQTQYGLLRSRTLAERAVTKFNLADNQAFLNQGQKRSLLHRGGSTGVAGLPRQA